MATLPRINETQKVYVQKFFSNINKENKKDILVVDTVKISYEDKVKLEGSKWI